MLLSPRLAPAGPLMGPAPSQAITFARRVALLPAPRLRPSPPSGCGAVARLPGRGAYLHLSQKCFEQAERRRAFARALRLPGPLATGALGEYLAQRCGAPGAGLPGSASQGSDKNGIAGKAGSDRDERLMRTRR